jgi:16S rRNA (uracil1498-N3)-methyltransferase
MDDVVRDAVMMGVAAIQPVLCARTEIGRAVIDRGRRIERWQRIAVSSAKQSGRAVVPRILDALELDELAGAIAARTLPSPGFMLVEPGARADRSGLEEVGESPPREATILVGPEGGWTAEEIAAGAAACRLLTIGGRTLRADAMATVALAALFTRWGEY